MSHTVFGIRHHGPGSSKSLVKALKTMKPDMVLIEGPTDANQLIPYVANKELKPPVAILIYNPKALHQASYYPFARFSPEWQAMEYGLEAGIPVEFMDLPMSMQFSLDENADTRPELFTNEEKEQTEEGKEDNALERDPMGYMAKLAGYEDSERWWEVMFEAQEAQIEVFPAIVELIGTLRKEIQRPETPRTLQREAFMRKTIRAAIKKGYKNIAVVCGAWHSPVLADLKPFPISKDNKVLRGIKKLKTDSTWVPWTYERISFQSGYGAGVVSPAWYKLLFSKRKDIVTRWMVKVARTLRKEDLDASSAHVIEAVRLADMLSTMRGLPVPGIQELREAAVTLFGGGYEETIEFIDKKLIIGDAIGSVPSEIPTIPLYKDLEKQVKTARLSKEYKVVESINKNLDIRKETNLKASYLLHRLNILGIDWGNKQHIGRNKKGGFHEHWTLRWKVSFPLRIIEAGMWGNTVYNAATSFVNKKAQDAEQLPELTVLMESALNANLTHAIPLLTNQLKNLSALTKDVTHLMDSLEPLVKVVRYGNTRGTDTSAVEQVVDSIIPRIFIGLPPACVAIDEAATKDMFEKLLETSRAISTLNKQHFIDEWHETLFQMSEIENMSGIIGGACSRILFDKGFLDEEKAVEHTSYALSPANESLYAAQWIEGFLHGSGLLLIHNPALWNILDNWVSQLDEVNFQDILPLLRRTFSEFAPPERRQMMDLAKRGQVAINTITSTENDWDEARANLVVPTLQLLFGG